MAKSFILKYIQDNGALPVSLYPLSSDGMPHLVNNGTGADLSKRKIAVSRLIVFASR